MRHRTDITEAPEAMTNEQVQAITYQVCEYRRKLLPGEAAAFGRLEPWEQMCFAFGVPPNRQGRSMALRMSRQPKYAAPAGWEELMNTPEMQRLTWIQRIIQALKALIK